MRALNELQAGIQDFRPKGDHVGWIISEGFMSPHIVGSYVSPYSVFPYNGKL